MKTNGKLLSIVSAIVLVLILSISLGLYARNKNKDQSSNSNNLTPTPTLTTTPISGTITPTAAMSGTISPSTTSTTTQVKVYFSKSPESDNDPAYIVSVNRATNRSDVGTFAIEELIKGPSVSEKSSGLYTPLVLTGDSNCDGKDFTLNIDSNKTATIKLCKNFQSPGELSDGRILNEVNSTLKQFPTVTKVIFLTRDNHCFGDLSGMDSCKK